MRRVVQQEHAVNLLYLLWSPHRDSPFCVPWPLTASSLSRTACKDLRGGASQPEACRGGIDLLNAFPNCMPLEEFKPILGKGICLAVEVIKLSDIWVTALLLLFLKRGLWTCLHLVSPLEACVCSLCCLAGLGTRVFPDAVFGPSISSDYAKHWILPAPFRFTSAIRIWLIFVPHWCKTWLLLAFINFFCEGHYIALWKCLKCAELDVDTLIACIKLVGDIVIKFIEQLVKVLLFGRNCMCFVFPDEWFIGFKDQFSINQGVSQPQSAPCVCVG